MKNETGLDINWKTEKIIMQTLMCLRLSDNLESIRHIINGVKYITIAGSSATDVRKVNDIDVFICLEDDVFNRFYTDNLIEMHYGGIWNNIARSEKGKTVKQATMQFEFNDNKFNFVFFSASNKLIREKGLLEMYKDTIGLFDFNIVQKGIMLERYYSSWNEHAKIVEIYETEAYQKGISAGHLNVMSCQTPKRSIVRGIIKSQQLNMEFNLYKEAKRLKQLDPNKKEAECIGYNREIEMYLRDISKVFNVEYKCCLYYLSWK